MSFEKSSAFGRLGKYQPIDFTSCQVLPISLGGAMSKMCVLYNNQPHILKFDKEGSQAIVSEYLACNIAKELELACQEVVMGFYQGEICCAIKMMTGPSLEIHTFKEIQEQSNLRTPNKKKYALNSILEFIKTEQNKRDFQWMCFFDALIGNFDRHWGNWGFHKGEMIPMFDNGSSLYPRFETFEIEQILDYKSDMMLQRVYEFPTSQIRTSNGKKYSYINLVEDLVEIFGKEELIKFYEKLDSIDFSKLLQSDDLRYFFNGDKIRFLENIIRLRKEVIFERLVKEEL